VWLFRCSMNGFTNNNKAVLLYCIFHNHNHIGVATQRARGLQLPVKDRDTLIEQSVTRINEAQRILTKQVVYDKFMKQIRTVKHSFNTTGTANYRVQLTVPPSIKIIIILFSKKSWQTITLFSRNTCLCVPNDVYKCTELLH